jgi:N-terminal half of MaoC dehydratase
MNQYRVPVEEGMIRLFARAIGDANPRFAAGDSATPDEIAAVDAPPTFVQVGMQFDETYEYRPVAGQPWMGSGKEPSGDPVRLKDGTLLRAEQHFQHFKTLHPGVMLHATTHDGASWEKSGRNGTVRFQEIVTEYGTPTARRASARR